MKFVSKKYFLVISMTIAFAFGVFMPSGFIEARGVKPLECWSADEAHQGFGYYRCVPSLKCKWVENRLPKGDTDACLELEEDEGISP